MSSLIGCLKLKPVIALIVLDQCPVGGMLCEQLSDALLGIGYALKFGLMTPWIPINPSPIKIFNDLRLFVRKRIFLITNYHRPVASAENEPYRLGANTSGTPTKRGVDRLIID
jgi:hypothetical protein